MEILDIEPQAAESAGFPQRKAGPISESFESLAARPSQSGSRLSQVESGTLRNDSRLPCSQLI
jgi:hypothetical protein